MAKVKIEFVNGLKLAPTSKIYREPPRPIHSREPDYEEKFDFHTIVYDLYQNGEKIEAICPPLRNLKNIISNSATIEQGDRTDRILIPKEKINTLIEQKESTPDDYKFGKKQTSDFKNKKVLITLSKNNDIQWICDWLTFHSKIHGVTSALIYDNNTTKYKLNELADKIKKIETLENVTLVKWPYKYGPVTKALSGKKGGAKRHRSDSNYCQSSVLEHARRKYLAEAELVINCDIDELIVSKNAVEINQEIEKSGSPGVLFAGHWILPITKELDERTALHKDYYLYDPDAPKCPAKWAIKPKKMPEDCQWMTHRISKLTLPTSKNLVFRHFRGINTNWKVDRTTPPESNASSLVDEPLVRDLKIAFETES